MAQEKRPRFAEWDYWGLPVPGFGDPAACLCIVGLAPASHGGNRTGRVFTGDPSATFLMAALHQAGFASQPSSEHRDDGLRLHDAYILAALRCVPPNDRPTAGEMAQCRPFMEEEMGLLPDVRAVLALGRIGFDACLRTVGGLVGKRPQFRHGARHDLGDGLPTLFASYHPSPRNTNTGRLTAEAFAEVLADIQEHLGAGS
jgi:uracil-DNA glycosylase family 4